MRPIGGRNLRKAFGAHLRSLREGAGISQEALASRAGLHRTYVGSVERGERNPTLESMFVLAQALEVPLQTLLDFPLPEV
ncbi:MAG: helix-turn-helix domain-containing protein [bacterium]